MTKTDELLKEKIIKILRERISAYQICNDDDPIEISGIGLASDDLVELIAQVEEEGIEDELKSYLEYNGADESDREILIKSYIKSEWFRNRMSGSSEKTNNPKGDK